MEEISLTHTIETYVLFEKHIKSKGISYTHLARQSQYSPSYIQKICRGIFPLTQKVRLKLNGILDTDY